MALTGNIEDYPEGIIIPVDKPYRWTSADVIRKVKYQAIRHFNKKNLKVGHAGTLDPLATGVLLVCIGKATKLAEDLQKHEKQYLAGVTFGATTPSYDLEKEVDRMYPLDGVSQEALEAALPAFIGPQEQIAPLFSAKSVDGVRAYEMARKLYRAAQREGGDFDHSASELLSKQNIVISEMQLVSYQARVASAASSSEAVNAASGRIHVADVSGLDLPQAEILVTCSKGTYIRALARDLGETLGSGAFLHSLRRTRNGGFRVEDALSVEEVMEIL
ncbi:MAG: tRNA pseudouridine(55) synthase TruB [Bacteroidia bacterium]|nr:tRNA pseudouridine(55) synthase TruB [Bacteroidia bacterium]